MDVQRDSLVLPNCKNPNLIVKRVFLPGVELGLTRELLLWAKEQGVADDEPLFFSRKRDTDGSRGALQRGQAWLIVTEASERANLRILALRASKHGLAGEAAPVHPHLFRHARVRQIVRSTRNLPLAQRHAGWSRLQLAYRTLGDADEAWGAALPLASSGALQLPADDHRGEDLDGGVQTEPGQGNGVGEPGGGQNEPAAHDVPSQRGVLEP